MPSLKTLSSRSSLAESGRGWARCGSGNLPGHDESFRAKGWERLVYVVATMKANVLAGDYIQADKTMALCKAGAPMGAGGAAITAYAFTEVPHPCFIEVHFEVQIKALEAAERLMSWQQP